MRIYYTFNEEETKYVLDNYKVLTMAEIANEIGNGCTKNHVRRLLRDNGIDGGEIPHKHRGRKTFSADDIAFIKEHYEDMTYDEIGRKLGYTGKQVRNKARNIGLRKRRIVNTLYFHNIDTSLKAYFLGFIFADGWVIHNTKTANYELGMELQHGDKYILDRLNEELGGDNLITNIPGHDMMICGKMRHKNESDVLRVFSKQIVEDLMSHGISTNKTLKPIHPLISNELFFDFLRGYIDGDGCFYVDNGCTYMHITCATQPPLQYIRDTLFHFNIETRIYQETDRKYRLMCVNTNEMIKLVNRLYKSKDVFCLSRKIKRVDHLLGLAA